MIWFLTKIVPTLSLIFLHRQMYFEEFKFFVLKTRKKVKNVKNFLFNFYDLPLTCANICVIEIHLLLNHNDFAEFEKIKVRYRFILCSFHLPPTWSILLVLTELSGKEWTVDSLDFENNTLQFLVGHQRQYFRIRKNSSISNIQTFSLSTF